MSERAWHIYAYRKQDDTGAEIRRGVPEWRLAQAVNWAVALGADTVLIEVHNHPATSTRQKTHHLCSGAASVNCPGGCE